MPKILWFFIFQNELDYYVFPIYLADYDEALTRAIEQNSAARYVGGANSQLAADKLVGNLRRR